MIGPPYAAERHQIKLHEPKDANAAGERGGEVDLQVPGYCTDNLVSRPEYFKRPLIHDARAPGESIRDRWRRSKSAKVEAVESEHEANGD